MRWYASYSSTKIPNSRVKYEAWVFGKHGFVWIGAKWIARASSKTVISHYLSPSNSENAGPVFPDENIQEKPEIQTYMLNLPVV